MCAVPLQVFGMMSNVEIKWKFYARNIQLYLDFKRITIFFSEYQCLNIYITFFTKSKTQIHAKAV